MSKVKIGILGAGFIAKVHIGNLKNDERTEIAAVASTLPANTLLGKATTVVIRFLLYRPYPA